MYELTTKIVGDVLEEAVYQDNSTGFNLNGRGSIHYGHEMFPRRLLPEVATSGQAEHAPVAQFLVMLITRMYHHARTLVH